MYRQVRKYNLLYGVSQIESTQFYWSHEHYWFVFFCLRIKMGGVENAKIIRYFR